MSVLFITSRTSSKYISYYFRSQKRDVLIVEKNYLMNVGISEFVAYIDELVEKNDISAIYGTHPFSAPLAAFFNEKYGFVGTSLSSVLKSQNKYASRGVQHDAGILAPGFALGKDFEKSDVAIPCFVKPGIGSSSYLAKKIYEVDELLSHISDYEHLIREQHLVHDYLQKQVGGRDFDGMFEFVCEEYIPEGEQITVEGFVQNGVVDFYGITLSCFIDGTHSFDRFEFPFSYGELDQKIYAETAKVVEAHGLDHVVFNVEFRIPFGTSDLYFLEINPRPATQFMPLVHRVSGAHPLDVMYSLAMGEKPDYEYSRRQGVAVSFVLRRRKDARVVRVPDLEEIEIVKQAHDFDFFNLVDVGLMLSDYRQDEETFRYGFVNVYAENFDEAQNIFHEIKERIGYEFEEV